MHGVSLKLAHFQGPFPLDPRNPRLQPQALDVCEAASAGDAGTAPLVGLGLHHHFPNGRTLEKSRERGVTE